MKGLGKWAAKQGERSPEQAISLLRSYAVGSDTAAVPLPFVDRGFYEQTIGNRELNEKIRQAPIVDIPISCLTAIQHTVRASRVEQYIRDPKLTKAGSMNPKSRTPIDVPVVVKLGGKCFLHDGNHRTVARVLLGCRSIKGRMVDLDAA